MTAEHVDVLIVGAGLSGVGAARHLQKECPGKSFALLESRERLGGTWDLFRYPGVRSDSDMHTLGYVFRPWTEAEAIADGPAILNYVRATAADHGIDQHIRFNHRLIRAAWSSAAAAWTLEIQVGPDGGVTTMTCGFLLVCAGYYDYAQGHAPELKDADAFQGQIVHPQQWPEDLAYEGRRIVVIGSGATAVTVVPEMAKTAAHVTMLQRSPTYVVSRPRQDAAANWLRRRLPARLAYSLVRWRNVLFGLFFFRTARRKPAETKARLVEMVRAELGPDYDVATHFTPRYNPWDQRLCLVPDGDLFKALRSGRAEVVTGQIERLTPHGVRLTSGQELAADIIVTATGLKLKLLGGVKFEVDGEARDLSQSTIYKGMMISDTPNLAFVFGYTNASWTLKADLTAQYVCRLLNHMDHRRQAACAPVLRGDAGQTPFLDFTSGYVTRAADAFPKQGSKPPWKLHQNYLLDVLTLRFGAVEDGVMTFYPQPTRAAEDQAAALPLAAE